MFIMLKTMSAVSNDNISKYFIGPPTAPVGPIHFTMATADSVTLDWQPPKDDGGSPVSSYKIMLSKDGSDWSEVATPARYDKEYTATNLEEGNNYIFRVIAVNKVGDSKPLESESVAPKKPAGEGNNLINDWCQLLWIKSLIPSIL